MTGSRQSLNRPIITQRREAAAQASDRCNNADAAGDREPALPTVLTRRNVIMACVATSIVASPSIAIAAGGAGDEPDAQILALGVNFKTALATYASSWKEERRIRQTIENKIPRPNAIIEQSGEASLFALGHRNTSRVGCEYLPTDVAKLRGRSFPGTTAARAREIVCAYDTYKEARRDVALRIGAESITHTFYGAFEAVSDLATKILATRATTIGGLRVKARAAAWCHGGAETDETATDEQLAWSIIRDLLEV